MWYGSSFSLISIDNSSMIAVTPRYHVISIFNVTSVYLTSSLSVRVSFGTTLILDNYPNFNGTISVRNCTLTVGEVSMLQLFDVQSLLVDMKDVTLNGNLLTVVMNTFPRVSWNPQHGASETCAMSFVRIAIQDSIIRSSDRLLSLTVRTPTNGILLSAASSHCLLSLDVSRTYIWTSIDADTLIKIETFSKTMQAPYVTLSIGISVQSCVIDLEGLLGLLIIRDTPGTSQLRPIGPPVLLGSLISLESVQLTVQSATDTNVLGTVTDPTALFRLSHVNASFIRLHSCSLTVQQNTSSFQRPPPPALVDIANTMENTSITLSNVSAHITSTHIGTGNGPELRPPALSIGAMSDSNVTLTNTTLTNLLALLQLPNASSAQNRNALVAIGCGNAWCAPADGLPCAPPTGSLGWQRLPTARGVRHGAP
jgi:hypothetical protein